MEPVLNKIKEDYPDLTFKPGKTACWAPQDSTVYYGVPFNKKEVWSLLHEIGHAVSNHDNFENDIDLLLKEVEAWELAKKIAPTYDIVIEDNYAEGCLDSYRDWLHKRSSCPKCGLKGLNKTVNTYTCPNCQSDWIVSNNQMSRPYRKLK